MNGIKMHNKRVNLNEFAGKAIDIINNAIDIKIPQSAKYSQKDNLKVVVGACVSNTSAESVWFENPGLPSADTVLGNIRKHEAEYIKEQFDGLIGKTLKMVKNQRWFRKPVTLAIDFHDDLYYGEKNTEGIIGIKSERGASTAYRIATIEIVEIGKRFTLACVFVVKGTKREDIIKYLITEAKKHVKIECVLMDRGFYDVQVVKILNELRVQFIIFSKIYKKLRKVLDIIGKADVMMAHMIGTKYTGCENVKFVSHYENSRKMRFSYITNMDIMPNEAYTVYGKRWGIETGYRVKGCFEAKTCSKSHSIRTAYMMFSICLYNLWALVNLIVDHTIIERVVAEFGCKATSKQYKPSITTMRLKHAFMRRIYIESFISNQLSFSITVFAYFYSYFTAFYR